MAVESVQINTGSGPQIAADLVGTSYYQVVKIVNAADGDSGTLGAPISVTGTMSVTGTVSVGTPTVTVSSMPVVSVRDTAPSNLVSGYTVVVDSAAAIVIASGAHTIYVTDVLVSVDVPMTVSLRSATTAKASVYLATKGGFVFPMRTPMVLNSAQSLTFLPTVSGSASCYAAGYTVT